MTRQQPQPTGGRRRPDQELKHAHELLHHWGITLSPGKVRNLVREYRHKVAPRGITFETYLRNAVIDAGDTHVRRRAGQVLDPEAKGRATPYNDQATGETATWNVLVERDLPQTA